MYFRVNYRWADETIDNVRNDLQDKPTESRTIGALDNNADNKVQIDELTGTMALVVQGQGSRHQRRRRPRQGRTPPPATSPAPAPRAT